jgi:hypothetical protein
MRKVKELPCPKFPLKTQLPELILPLIKDYKKKQSSAKITQGMNAPSDIFKQISRNTSLVFSLCSIKSLKEKIPKSPSPGLEVDIISPT